MPPHPELAHELAVLRLSELHRESGLCRTTNLRRAAEQRGRGEVCGAATHRLRLPLPFTRWTLTFSLTGPERPA